jgi:hypothetical protein
MRAEIFETQMNADEAQMNAEGQGLKASTVIIRGDRTCSEGPQSFSAFICVHLRSPP